MPLLNTLFPSFLPFFRPRCPFHFQLAFPLGSLLLQLECLHHQPTKPSLPSKISKFSSVKERSGDPPAIRGGGGLIFEVPIAFDIWDNLWEGRQSYQFYLTGLPGVGGAPDFSMMHFLMIFFGIRFRSGARGEGFQDPPKPNTGESGSKHEAHARKPKSGGKKDKAHQPFAPEGNCHPEHRETGQFAKLWPKLGEG